MNIFDPTDHWVKLKESEKLDKYLDHAKKLRKVWNVKVTVIPFVIRLLGRVPNGCEKSWEENQGKNHSDN